MLRRIFILLLLPLAGCKGWDDDVYQFPQYEYSLLLIETGNQVALYRATPLGFSTFTYSGQVADDIITGFALHEQHLYAALPAKRQLLRIDLKSGVLLNRWDLGFAVTSVVAGDAEVMACGPGKMAFVPYKNPDKWRETTDHSLLDSLVHPAYVSGNYFLAGKTAAGYAALVVNATARTPVVVQPLEALPAKWAAGTLLAGSAGSRIRYVYDPFTRSLQGPAAAPLLDMETSTLYRRPYEREYLGSVTLLQDSSLAQVGVSDKATSLALDSWGSQLVYTTPGAVVFYHLGTRQSLGRIPLPGISSIRHAVHYYRY
ncbi:MAG: hypothetical protein KF690_07910 [Bacteroidetes bacterium]|nr:hypothetical protein [Bacteroidota bacterium]